MDTGGHAAFGIYRRRADAEGFQLVRTLHLEGGRRTYELLGDALEGDHVTLLKLTAPFVGAAAARANKSTYAPVALYG
eukprot:6237879-Prymnesium_polylepis.1